MKRFSKTALLIGLAFVASTGFAGAALAAPDGNTQATPKNWNYEIKDGKRVPKGNRVVNADGSWREEVRQGKSITVKEKTANGEYRETRRCD
jgi:lipopolysaccharide export system protein LptA